MESNTISALFMLLGLVLLYFGAEGLVRGSASLALRFGMTPLMVGLTIVAFGTSAPELVVSIKSALSNYGNIAIGNVVGSNIFNIAVILGASAVVRPLRVKAKVLRIDTPIMIGLSALFIWFLRDTTISRFEAAILLSILIGYTIMNFLLSKAETAKTELPETVSKNIWIDLLFIVGGLALLVTGSRFLVDGAISLARSLGISEAVIGLTIVAAGTSLPELATSIVAGVRGEDDIAIGNIVGSNIFNIICILGFTPFFGPVAGAGIRMLDLGFMMGIAVLLFPLMWSRFTVGRIEGAILVLLYCTFMYLTWPV